MILLIDIGNQRLKWATSEQILSAQPEISAIEDKVLSQQAISVNNDTLKDELARCFKNIDRPERILVSSVSSHSVAVTLTEACEQFWKCTPEFLTSDMEIAGMKNPYYEPVKLGIDRWAAMAGAHFLEPDHNLVIVDAGTAVTVDFMESSGNCLGGVIFPGFATMIRSLNFSTSQIRISESERSFDKLQFSNHDTFSAVKNGAMFSMVSGIDRAIELYAATKSSEVKILTTGGDAKLVVDHSKNTMKRVPALVMTGLMIISGELRLK